MFNSQFVVWVLFLHWVFDFVFQADKMALNKSKSIKWLVAHGSVYALMGLLVGLPTHLAAAFYVYLFITHCCIDAVTSRLTSYLYARQQRHWFFVMIGFDQVVHYLTIFWWLGHAR